MLTTIKLGVQIRHMIVHKAADIKLPDDVFHLALFFVNSSFCCSYSRNI